MSVRETHVSWLVFVGDRVYKVKKPVRFDFLDWRDVVERRRACRMEVDLNRRLSPDVYLGVAEFTPPDGPVEPVVVMRRLPGDRSLSALISAGDDTVADEVARVAAVLSGFHRNAARGPEVSADCTVPMALRLWERNLAAMAAIRPSPVRPRRISELSALSERYLRGRHSLIEERVAAGCAVDGHGDLLCDDIYCMKDGPRVLDCLEFDPALRHGDTAADVSALAMDLEHHGRPDLASTLVIDYERLSGDHWPVSLTDFWIAYRATVRAKVSLLRGGDAQADEGRPDREEAVTLVDLALEHLVRAQVRMVLVGGLPGTGKSTLVGLLAQATGWSTLGSDLVRPPAGRAEAGRGEASRFGEGRYSDAELDGNYRRLLSAASERLGRGQSVILDASWSRGHWRRWAETTAASSFADLVTLRCVVPRAVAERRLTARNRQGPGPSEATPAIAREMATRWDAWPRAVEIDTSRAQEEALQDALSLLARHRLFRD